MRYSIFLMFLLCMQLLSCTTREETKSTITNEEIDSALEIPNRIVHDSLLQYNNMNSLWMLDNQLFSGYAESYYQDNTIKIKMGILNGRKQNQELRWYPDGHFKQVANYHKGKLHGEKKKWCPDASHILVAHLNYQFGKVHGEQKLWYPTGELFKKLSMNLGIEEGLQQAYRKNGALFANYEAKEGRIFGLKKAALCFGIEDENIKYAD